MNYPLAHMDKVLFLSLVYIYIYIYFNILRRYSEQEVLLNQPEVHSRSGGTFSFQTSKSSGNRAHIARE